MTPLPVSPVDPAAPPAATPSPAATEPRFARRVTDGLEPKNWIIVVTLLIGWQAGRWSGVGWG